MTAQELKAQIDKGEDVFILDVREPNEYQICRIPGSTLIPLGEVAARSAELDRNRDIVVNCKVGRPQRESRRPVAGSSASPG